MRTVKEQDESEGAKIKAASVDMFVDCLAGVFDVGWRLLHHKQQSVSIFVAFEAKNISSRSRGARWWEKLISIIN